MAARLLDARIRLELQFRDLEAAGALHRMEIDRRPALDRLTVSVGGAEQLLGRLEAQGRYAEFIDRWTHKDFQAYVRALLALVDEHPHPRQQAMFNEVMRHERDFWRMTWEG